MRGLLEVGIAKKLNSEGRVWTRGTRIVYHDKDGFYRTYTPDFYIPEEDLFIEAKGYFSEHDQDKLNMVCEQNIIQLAIVFSVW